MPVYNISKIEYWYNTFTSCNDRFKKNYEDLNSSYIKASSDTNIKKIYDKLNKHYARINRIYKNINNVWKDYLSDLNATENALAGKGGAGRIKASIVSSKISKLPKLPDYKSDISIKLSSLNSSTGAVKKLGISENRTLSKNISYAYKRAYATIGTAVVSVIEGATDIVEGVIDAASATICEGIAKVPVFFTACMILLSNDTENIQKWSKKMNEAEEFGELLMEESRAFVSYDIVGSSFSVIYEETGMKDDAFAFDTVRSMGCEMSQYVICQSVDKIAPGIGSAIYGVSKFGKHLETNWQDPNADTDKAFVKSFYQGAGDTAFFMLNSKMDSMMKNAMGKYANNLGRDLLTSERVISLGGKATVEGVVNMGQSGSEMFIDALFLDNTITDSNGNVITFKSLGDKLKYSYQQAGGSRAFAQDFAIGFGGSIIGDMDIAKNFNLDDFNAEKAANNAMKAGVISDSISAKNIGKYSAEEIESINPKNIEVSSNVKNASINDDLDDLRKEYDELLNKTKEPWFIETKKAEDSKYAVAWDLEKIKEVDDIEKRIRDLESAGVHESKIYYQDIEEADFNRLRQILDEWGESRGYENYSERALKQYAKTGSVIDPKTGNYYITSTNGARSYLSKLNPDDVAKYLGDFKNSKAQGITEISKIKNHPDSKLFTEIDVRERFGKAKKFNTPLEIAQEFNDAQQYLYYKGCSYQYDDATLKEWREITCNWDGDKQRYIPKSAYDIDEKKLFEFLEKRNLLSDTDKMILNGMKGDTFTQEEKSIICMFTQHGGPALSAFNRKTKISFLNRTFEPNELEYVNECVKFYNINHNPPIKSFSSMEEFNNAVDKIASKGIIKQDTIVYRSIDGIFSDGKMLDLNSIKPGDTFNDSAHTSVSVKKIISKGEGNGIFDRKVQLQILLPEGSRGTYIDSYAGTGLYRQQEILLPRNSTFRVIDYPTIDANGVYTYKVELLPPKDAHLPELSTKSNLNLYGKMFNKQDKQKEKGAKELLNSMQNNGLLTRFNNEVDDMINKELYNGPKAIAEHDLTHAKNVLLYSMEMGNNLKLNNNQFELLVDAAKYHDVGVVNAKTHSNHAVLSSLKIGNDLSLGKKYSEPDLNKLKAIVEFHEKNDIIKLNDGTYRYSDKSLTEVCAKYNITDPKDIDDVKMIGSILKDADALDRTRFIGNIDVNYFRNKEECLDLLPASYELREAISSDEFQKNMNSSRFSETEKNEAWYLYNSEKYPVALINFGLKYYKNYNCTSITNYINSVLK